MKFYLATSFIFPRSLRMRIFFLCFVATHVPLLTYTVWGLTTGRIAAAAFWLLLTATAVGTVLALLGIGALLAPIEKLADALDTQDEEEGGEGAVDLSRAQDLIQRLYNGVHRARRSTDKTIRDLDVAANEDMLTGILNRRGFMKKVNALPASQRHGCFAILDIDHFKRVNDEMGHDEGDRVLRALAGRLSEQTRRADIVARWGGEEFVVFFNGVIETEACWALERIAWRMQGDPIGRIDDRPITFSGGVCRWVEGDLTGSLTHADEALYEAKRNGRDQVCTAVALTPAR
ncbi:GGDEF domain-containing protein [Novosphingobium sediminicola]|uniref:diguanylate cyclase n=1 Tax=Novosphingobium sediminicola TaxID=563162 RepID=A0A7W6CG31_9SPHN|nr:GGDEF domain-containing protein [Novosphingobium sediminicola]MBB3955876.1 diguanylate cyclase (GGDEF)-like protein [Novosphingobium sediminicola]